MEYLIPEEYTSTLSVLTSKAPEATYEDVVYVVESQLGKRVFLAFVSFPFCPELDEMCLVTTTLDRRGLFRVLRKAHRRCKSCSSACRQAEGGV